MVAPAALLDECVNLALVDLLIRRGYDVTSVQLVGPRGVDDDAVLARAAELGRVLITHNVADFRSVDANFRAQGRRHTGIVGLPQLRGAPLRRLELRAAMMLDWLATLPDVSRLFIWGQLQQLLERGFQPPGYGENEIREALGRSRS